jgi:hypothetical protein
VKCLSYIQRTVSHIKTENPSKIALDGAISFMKIIISWLKYGSKSENMQNMVGGGGVQSRCEHKLLEDASIREKVSLKIST